jgi:hypothetical protein
MRRISGFRDTTATRTTTTEACRTGRRERMTKDYARLSKTCAWYAGHAVTAGLRSVLLASAEALEEAAERASADADVERLIAEAYR